MKKTLSSLYVGIALLTTSSLAYADNLLTVYQQAQKNDPQVLKAKAQFNAAQAGIKQVRAALLPQLSAGASYSKASSESIADDKTQNSAGNLVGVGTIYESDVDSTALEVSLSMSLYNHGSWLQFDNAKKAAHQADIGYQAAKQQLIVRVTSAYFAVLSAQDDLEFAKAEKKAIERQLEQTKQRFSVGLTAITDVHEAQAQFDNAIASEIRAENQVFNAEEALREITNVYPTDLARLNTERFSPSRPLPSSANEWQKIAEEKNLGLIAQKISVEIAKENIDIASSGHLPSLSLAGSYSSETNDVTSLGSSINGEALSSNYIGISLSVPIYSGGATSAGVEGAQASYVAASQDLAQTHRNVVRTTRNTYNTVISQVSTIKAFEQSVISAESALKATEAGFEVGTRTIVDVLNSTRNLYNAKRNLSSTRYGYIQAILSLKLAAGTITEKDLMQVNAGLTQG